MNNKHIKKFDQEITELKRNQAQLQDSRQMDVEFLTVEETAEFLKLPKATVYFQIYNDIFPSYRVGKYRRIDKAELIKKIKQG